MRNLSLDAFVAILVLASSSVCRADLSGTVTLTANRTFNFDTGVSAGIGGDVFWDGGQLSVQGNALWGILGRDDQASFDALTLTEIESASFQGQGLPAANIFPNTQIAVRTNSVHFAKVLLISVNGPSLTFEFTTFGVAMPSAPIITQISNNYSYIPPVFPNYGIAPGSIVYVGGGGLADPTAQTVLQSSAPPGLPLTLNGATVSVSVNGITVHPGFYYATAGQLAVVLPSNTPVGNGTLTVTYNNSTSQPANIVVAPSALGFVTYYGAPSQLGAITNPTTGAFYDYGHSARPGDTVVLWGSGLGGITADSDTVFTATPHASTSLLQIFIGGVPASIVYQGNSGYPGLNQINVTIPQSVSAGCQVTVAALSAGFVSNTIALPIAAGGGPCSDPALGVDGAQLEALSGQETVRTGLAEIDHYVNVSPDTAGVAFRSFAGDSYRAFGTPTSLGNCTTSQVIYQFQAMLATLLSPGPISVSGPVGTVALDHGSETPLPAGFIPASGGVFTFNGAAGTDVQSFTATVSVSDPVTWTNMAMSTDVTRSQGQTITWTGGDPNSIVEIGGGPSIVIGGWAGSYHCWVAASAGQFTVPSWALLSLPAGVGTTGIVNYSIRGFTAPGIDVGVGTVYSAQYSVSTLFH